MPRELAAALDDPSLAQESRRQLLKVVRLFYSWTGQEYGAPNPSELLWRIPKRRTLPRVLTGEEVHRLVDVAGGVDDALTGEYRLPQIVSFPDLPDGPDDLNQEVEIGIRLPPNSHGGPQISDNLGWWGVSSVPAYRALLNLAYYWHMPGRRKYQHEDYEPLTDDDLIELCYPAGISAKQRRKKLQEAKKTLGLLADAGELAIVPYGTSGRERRILPVRSPSSGNR